MAKRKQQTKRKVKLAGDDRIIDLLERLGALGLYLAGNVDQSTVARKLGMDINRINEILKGLKKKEK